MSRFDPPTRRDHVPPCEDCTCVLCKTLRDAKEQAGRAGKANNLLQAIARAMYYDSRMDYWVIDRASIESLWWAPERQAVRDFLNRVKTGEFDNDRRVPRVAAQGVPGSGGEGHSG